MAGTGEIANYLSTATADYTATQLDITPQEIMAEIAEFKQRCVEFDDASAGVITRSTTPSCYFTCKWTWLSDADANTIMDFYLDTAKAKGKARTIEFPHPTDGNTYIVRFWSKIERDIKYLKSIREIISAEVEN